MKILLAVILVIFVPEVVNAMGLAECESVPRDSWSGWSVYWAFVIGYVIGYILG